jgi:hypothetical protein
MEITLHFLHEKGIQAPQAFVVAGVSKVSQSIRK